MARIISTSPNKTNAGALKIGYRRSARSYVMWYGLFLYDFAVTSCLSFALLSLTPFGRVLDAGHDQ